jgi:hypothetical protein
MRLFSIKDAFPFPAALPKSALSDLVAELEMIAGRAAAIPPFPQYARA